MVAILLAVAAVAISIILGVLANWFEKPAWAKDKPGRVTLALIAFGAVGVIVVQAQKMFDSDRNSGLYSRSLGSSATASPPVTASGAASPPIGSASTRMKSDYIKEADAVCLRWYEENAKETQSDDSPSVKLRNINGIFHNLVGDWSRVERPHDDVGKIDSILSLYREANEIGDKLALAYDSHDKARYDQLGNESDQAMHDADMAARAYGHKVCGNY
ncbi:hypothetical protein [Dactylosporangium matsuzakiense]|uniref:Uncharacterized protein n=1 Tax=Dactylosporangium matsuzakiense TaxID=53360 RepID=A0A9W6KSU9_9ACTN|nr:hypothetical protein [Dactylosporangium matsuzakiense]GLL07531.1 hypothetical protein GCM10017581_092850 [Dactylosporangium matsuzakiense]